MTMEFGTGDGLGSSSYAPEICAASTFLPPIDEGVILTAWDSLDNLDLPPSNEMDPGLFETSLPTSHLGQCDGLESGMSPFFDNPPRVESFSSPMDLHYACNLSYKYSPIIADRVCRSNPFPGPFRQLSPRSHGGPQGSGNYKAAMTDNLESRQYVQHSSLKPPASGHTPFSFSNYRWTGEGLSQGKQSDDNGKDHEGAGNRRPAPTVGRAFVEKTYMAPPDAFPTGSEITPGDPCLEQQTVVGAKPQARSLSKRGKSSLQLVKPPARSLDKSANNKARSRSEDWSEFEDQILLHVKKKRSTLGSSKKPGESWSWRASEVLEESGFERSQTACQQRWDTLLKQFKSMNQLQKIELQPPPAFKNSAVYHLMQAAMGVHQKQQSPENDSCSSGQTVDASAQLAQETQVPIVSSHDPHMTEMIRHVVLRAIEGAEENMKSSQNTWIAAFSARLDELRQEVESIKEMHLVGETSSLGGSQTKVIADAVASTGEEHHAHRRSPN